MNGKLKALLVISLVLNVWMGGLIIGHMSQKWTSGIDDLNAALAGSTLTAEQQASMKEKLTAFRKENQEGWKKSDEPRKEILEILTAPTFDEAAYDAAMEKMMTMKRERRMKMNAAIKEMAKGMSQEERKVLTDVMERSRARWRSGNP